MATYFDWDEAKNASNRRKHGISFEEAVKVFDDPLCESEADRVEDGEQRWKSFGMVHGVLLVMVAHTWRDLDGDDFIRVISARYATKQEVRAYEGRNC